MNINFLLSFSCQRTSKKNGKKDLSRNKRESVILCFYIKIEEGREKSRKDDFHDEHNQDFEMKENSAKCQ